MVIKKDSKEQKEKVDALKKELILYGRYKKKIKMIKSQIKDVEYDMTGVKAINPSGSKGSSNPKIKQNKFYNLSDKRERLIKHKEFLESYVSYVDTKLRKIKDKTLKEAVVDMYAYNIPVRELCKKYNYSKSGEFKRIEETLKDIALKTL